jgi:hypothetical protein
MLGTLQATRSQSSLQLCAELCVSAGRGAEHLQSVVSLLTDEPDADVLLAHLVGRTTLSRSFPEGIAAQAEALDGAAIVLQTCATRDGCNWSPRAREMWAAQVVEAPAPGWAAQTQQQAMA